MFLLGFVSAFTGPCPFFRVISVYVHPIFKSLCVCLEALFDCCLLCLWDFIGLLIIGMLMFYCQPFCSFVSLLPFLYGCFLYLVVFIVAIWMRINLVARSWCVTICGRIAHYLVSFVSIKHKLTPVLINWYNCRADRVLWNTALDPFLPPPPFLPPNLKLIKNWLSTLLASKDQLYKMSIN